MSLGALGAIAGGINRGMDWAQRDQEIEDQRAMRAEDREYQRGLRGFQQKQQQRQEDQWNKDDQFQQDQAAIPNVGAVKSIKDTDLGPEQVKQTDSGYYRDLGNALKKKGDVEGALKSWKWADEAASQAAANAVIGRLSSLPKTGTDLKRIVEEIGAGVDADESPVGIDYKNVRPNTDGSVTVKAFNKRSGFSEDITINSIEDLKEKMIWHYAPDYAREQAAKRAEAANKTHDLQPGGQIVRGDGTVIATNNNEPSAVTAARIRAGATGATGAGAGTGSGKALKVDASPWIDIIDKLSNSDEDKPFRTAAAANSELISQLNSKIGLPPAVIANIGLQYAKNPEAATVTFDPQTGSWGKTIDFQGRRVVVNDRVKQEEVEKALPAQADALYTQLKSSNDPLLSVVQNPQERARWESGKVNSIAASLAKASGRNAIDPEVQKQAKAVFEAQDRPRLESISSLLSKSQMMTKDAKEAADKASGGSRSTWGGGLRPSSNYTPPPDSRVGQMRARNEQAATQRAEAEKAASEQRAAAAAVATEAADKVIASGDRRAARALQSSKEFDLLPREQKLRIWEIVNGVAR